MGPKMERKINTSGMSKPIIEFSDTELISDDEGGNQEYDPPAVPERIVGTNSPNISGSRPRKDEEKRSGTVVVNSAVKPTKDVNKQTQGDATTEILRPKRIREPEVRKSLTLENVCTSIFLSQLIIILVCVCIVTYGLNSYLNKTVHDTLHSEKQRVDDAIRELTKEQEKLKETLSQANKLREEYEAKVEMVNAINKRLEVIQPNVFNKEKFTIAFMILTLLVFGLLVAVFFLYQRPRAAADWASPAVMMNSMNSNDILKQVPQSPELKSSMCIISFDENRTAKHRGLLESAKVPNCKVLVHVIRKHEQIAMLPRCKVYLMCTEFSERHVIIEQPGLGLGDLHRTTYYAVQKLGGCLIILYTRDPGSKNLDEDSLFNRKIHCVTNQQELSVLNNDRRFFSTYDNLTQNQKTQLRNKIVQNLTGQLS